MDILLMVCLLDTCILIIDFPTVDGVHFLLSH